MSDVRLSASTKALIEAAKVDAPSATAKAHMWTGVSSMLSVTSGGAGSPPASGQGVGATAGASATKMLVLGALFGGTMTIGLAAALIRFTHAPLRAPSREVRSELSAPDRGKLAATLRLPPGSDHASADVMGDRPASPLGQQAEEAASRTPAASLSAVHRASEADRGTSISTRLPVSPHASNASAAPSHDTLAREASLVSAGRAALEHGDPEAALRMVRAARALPSRQLLPEELAVEAPALRALGREAEARAIDEVLRSQYPQSALSR